MVSQASNVALQGIQTYQTQIAVASNNIVNANNTGKLNDEGSYKGYIPQDVVSLSDEAGNIRSEIIDRSEQQGFVKSYAPQNAAANEQGYVGLPNVSLPNEMVTIMKAENAYKAALEVFKTDNQMQNALTEALDQSV